MKRGIAIGFASCLLLLAGSFTLFVEEFYADWNGDQKFIQLNGHWIEIDRPLSLRHVASNPKPKTSRKHK